MIISLLQALAFFLLTAGYVLRDYPWKGKSQARMRVFYSIFVLAILAFLSSIAVVFAGMEGEKSAFASGLVLVSVAAFGTTIILSMTVWPRKKKAMESGDQRAV